MRKKICFCTTIAGTIKSFLLDLSNYLVEHENYDVTFICDPSDSLLQYTNKHIHYIPVKMHRGISFDGCAAIWNLYKIFKREKFDIVQYATPNASLYASIAARAAGIKVRLYCQWGVRYIDFKGCARFLYRKLVKIMCNNATAIEVESFSILSFSLKDGLYKADKAQVIWNGSACGVNLDNYLLDMRAQWRKEIREKWDIPSDAVVFGWCGRITRDKGHNELFASFREILKDNKNARLLMVGKYDNVETIDKNLFAWAQSCPEVIFTGPVPPQEVSHMYSAMDVFCSLSYREGFGVVVIEAAAMKLPGIVTDVPGQLDTHENMINAVSVHARDVESVVKAMQFYIDNPDKIQSMGDEARRQVEMKYEQRELFRRLATHRNELIAKSK